MGLVSTLLLGPIQGVVWIAEQVRDAAERQYYDEGAILDGLASLNDEYDRGLLDDATFSRREDELLARLAVARTRARSRE